MSFPNLDGRPRGAKTKHRTKRKSAWGKGKPAKKDYEYRARPKKLDVRRRSDNPNAQRFPVTVHVNHDCDLEIRNQQGRRIDGRMSIVKAGKRILAELVAELGDPKTITMKQRIQLEVVIRRTLIGRRLFEATEIKGNESISQQIGCTNDSVLLKGLDQLYR